MAVRKLTIRKIKRLLVLAVVVVTVILLYLRNVVIIHGFARTREISTAEFVRMRKLERTENISRQAYRQSYQKNTSCPVLSIQSQHDDNMGTKYSDRCKPWKQTEDICAIANKFYSINKDIHCRGKAKNTSRNICSFAFSDQDVDKTPEINCDNQICRNGSLFVGSVNPEIGAITSQDWKEFRSAKSAELGLPGIISNNVKNGLRFCLIRCVKNDKNIDQLLTFSHIFKRYREELRDKRVRKIRVRGKSRRKDRGKERKLFNINILMLDSVSRNHFYRMLNKTVNTLRQAALHPGLLVLDYEFLQSLAPYTYKNIRALFTGTIEKEARHNLNQNIRINTLYGHFKRHRYRTLFQEDSCWHDRWGTVLENNIRKDRPPQSIEDFKISWGHFKNSTKAYAIDDYGLTHFSCAVLKMHGVTNMFNKPLKVCYDGQPISSYFLRYTQEVLNQANSKKRPTFSYLHTNFGHEETGLRITAIDDALSDFVRLTAKRKDTLTIILSDHGPKTTIYSQDYLHGRYETYDSLSFMIIPKNIQDELGQSRMVALIKNQKSLVTMQDIHEMLTEMTQLHKRKSSGLFSDISKRTCDSIQMVNYGVCKCRDWERLFIDQSPRFIGLAEFATESLNKKIREQLLRSNQSGLGKCRKLQLHRIWNIRQRISNGSYITTFDLVVQPFYTIFLVQTKHAKKNGLVDNIRLQSWRRVSLYRHYINCKDKSVDLELCVCNRKRQRNSNKRLLKMIEDAKVGKDNEIIKTRTSCLHILLTKVKDKLESIFSYDVINTCAIRYNFTINSLKNVKNLQGRKIIKELQPYTDTFLFSVVAKEKRKPTFKYYFKRT